ncbi:M3 family metallopeptidase [soil metagenome]
MTPIRSAAALACLLLASTAVAAAPLRPQIALLDAAGIERACDDLLVKARVSRSALEQGMGGPTLAALNRHSMLMQDLGGRLSLFAAVMTDPATRAAANACNLRASAFDTDMMQSERLYRRVAAIAPADATEAALKQRWIERFEDNGVSLPAEQRERSKVIDQRLDELNQQFLRNIAEDTTTVVMTEAEVAGTPESWRRARKRDADGSFRLELSNPSYVPFMQSASDAGARRRYWMAMQDQGGAGNVALMDEAYALRSEYAHLFGLPDFATFQLRRRMAGTPAAVNDFLASVKQAVTQAQISDVEGLRAAKAAALGTPLADTRLERWDVAFYEEAVRKQRFSIDQEALRKYFPTDASIAFTLKVASTLYGIRFAPRSVPTWHEDVQYFDVFEQGPNGRFIGGLYLDLFPRTGKYTHAAAWGVRGGSRLANRTPISALVTNFNRNGLTQEELGTLLHEFGHALHGVLTTARYLDAAGTRVSRDFVEAPSQMFEEWARRPESLALFAEVCRTCPRLDADQIARLEASRRFDSGLRYGTQWLYASFDMIQATGAPKSSQATWIALQRASPLGYVDGTLGFTSFSHLVGGYGAGYYGYLWSQSIALDMLSAFGKHLLDPKVGRRYRDIILAPGGERPAMELVEQFLGRKPDSDAFFREIVGKR